MAAKTLFEETQSNKYLIIAFLVISIVFGILIVIQLGFHQPIGNKPAPGWLLMVIFIGSIIGMLFLRAQKLKLLITENEIRIRFGLLSGETVISVSNIKSISIRKYNALKEFGGWGVRYNDTGSCFTVFGSDAIEIELAGNQKILVGTQKAKGMQPVLDQFLLNKTQ
ncbi:DUF6141 family protein [soil metagenome]|jgi:hypothetical protein